MNSTHDVPGFTQKSILGVDRRFYITKLHADVEHIGLQPAPKLNKIMLTYLTERIFPPSADEWNQKLVLHVHDSNIRVKEQAAKHILNEEAL